MLLHTSKNSARICRKIISKPSRPITTCRTEAHGFTVYEGGQCGKLHHIYRGCGNRHCPTCQNGKALDWLDRQLRRQLPGHHFMITFTVPESVRPFMRTHQKQAYTALFKASSQSIKKLAKDKKHIGGDIYLINPKVWDTDWNVNIAPVGSGHQTVKYLSQYVFKVAISDYRIETFDNGKVTFRYRKTGSNRDRRITLTAHEFIRRYLQHVLPTGLMKVRHYGFMSANCSVSLSDVKGLIKISLGFNVLVNAEPVAPERYLYCRDCGGKMHYRYSVLPYMLIDYNDGG